MKDTLALTIAYMIPLHLVYLLLKSTFILPLVVYTLLTTWSKEVIITINLYPFLFWLWSNYLPNALEASNIEALDLDENISITRNRMKTEPTPVNNTSNVDIQSTYIFNMDPTLTAVVKYL